MAAHPHTWKKLPISLEELCLNTVLRCGQSFRWKLSRKDEWSCALKGRILSLKQDSSYLHYRAIFPSTMPSPTVDTSTLVHDYLSLSIDLTSLYQGWSARDPNFSIKSTSFTGVRMLRQDPWENVVSFICSTNNNITRISQMVNNLCITWGKNLGNIDDEGVDYYDFPEPKAMAKPNVEQKLRELGFGYRAKYIANAAHMIVNKRPIGWLEGLRDIPYKKAHEALLELPGVGPKVADCVCLMSLDKKEAVPVDTHVWQIAQRDYKFLKIKNKTLTKVTYDAIGDYFRELWGHEAGWAHSVLFAADLKVFKGARIKSNVIKVGTNEQYIVKPLLTKKRKLLTETEANRTVTLVTTVKKLKLEDKIETEELPCTTLAERVKARRR